MENLFFGKVLWLETNLASLNSMKGWILCDVRFAFSFLFLKLRFIAIFSTKVPREKIHLCGEFLSLENLGSVGWEMCPERNYIELKNLFCHLNKFGIRH